MCTARCSSPETRLRAFQRDGDGTTHARPLRRRAGREATHITTEDGALTVGGHERRLAIGALAQQVSGLAAALAMFVAITVLARQLSLAELGTYGLLVSFATYLIFVQASIEIAAVKAIAEALDEERRNLAFSTALSLYIVAGIAAGALTAVLGITALRLFEIPDRLHRDAEMSLLALGVVTAIGWPTKTFLDLLRGTQRFVLAAVAEGVGIVLAGVLLVTLVLAGAPLWALVAVGGGLPLFVGTVSLLVVLTQRVTFRFETRAVSRESLRGFLGISGYLFLGGVADLAIYSVDRAVLAVFRPAAVVGLYEGPVRLHTLLQQVHSSLVTPVVAASAQFVAERDTERTRDLLVRGMRYTLAAVVPLALVVMILAEPILDVWLGRRFTAASNAMAILASYWLLYGCSGVPGRMLITAGRVRVLTGYAIAVAIVNVAISIALTPSLGLEGVVLGTAISYIAAFPFFIRVVVSTFPVRLADIAREVWLPAYVTAIPVGAGLLAARLSLSLETLTGVVITAVLGLLAYWGIYYLAWLRPGEKALVVSIARTALGRR
jgi:O-antigen/teichoic acid export membrane protein